MINANNINGLTGLANLVGLGLACLFVGVSWCGCFPNTEMTIRNPYNRCHPLNLTYK